MSSRKPKGKLFEKYGNLFAKIDPKKLDPNYVPEPIKNQAPEPDINADQDINSNIKKINNTGVHDRPLAAKGRKKRRCKKAKALVCMTKHNEVCICYTSIMNTLLKN